MIRETLRALGRITTALLGLVNNWLMWGMLVTIALVTAFLFTASIYPRGIMIVGILIPIFIAVVLAVFPILTIILWKTKGLHAILVFAGIIVLVTAFLGGLLDPKLLEEDPRMVGAFLLFILGYFLLLAGNVFAAAPGKKRFGGIRALAVTGMVVAVIIVLMGGREKAKAQVETFGKEISSLQPPLTSGQSSPSTGTPDTPGARWVLMPEDCSGNEAADIEKALSAAAVGPPGTYSRFNIPKGCWAPVAIPIQMQYGWCIQEPADVKNPEWHIAYQWRDAAGAIVTQRPGMTEKPGGAYGSKDRYDLTGYSPAFYMQGYGQAEMGRGHFDLPYHPDRCIWK